MQAQPESAFPPGLGSFTGVDCVPLGGKRVDLTNNTPEVIRSELLDRGLIEAIGKAHGLPAVQANGVRVFCSRDDESLLLGQFEATEKTFILVWRNLQIYTQGRYDGHSRGFMMACITNPLITARGLLTDDLKRLGEMRPELPAGWLKLAESGTETNQAGVLSRWAAYTVTDSEITWRYFLSFKPDGSLNYVFDSKFDSKEIDPGFRTAIEQVESLVTQEMKRDGSYGKFGSCHHSWELKKEKLREKGILWRSPAELNPNTCFD